MMAKNPHHRVLALSATPGNNPEAVQSIVDSLHISHIEIRNEESQDLIRYVLKKVSFAILTFFYTDRVFSQDSRTSRHQNERLLQEVEWTSE